VPAEAVLEKTAKEDATRRVEQVVAANMIATMVNQTGNVFVSGNSGQIIKNTLETGLNTS
jgi:hypothetical protein